MGKDEDEIAKIKELLKNEPRGMSIRQITDELPVNRNLVAKFLDMLLVSGQVEMRTVGMAKMYYLSHRVPISAMMDASSDFIVVLDENLRIIRVNDNFLEFSSSSREEIIGKTIGQDTIPVLAADSSLAAARDALKGKEITEDIVFNRQGAAFHYHTKFIPTVFENGAPGLTVILEDTTDIWRAEQTLRSTLREKEILLGDINQRINNNLQLVLSFIDLQMESVPAGSGRESLRETQNRIMALSLVYGQIGAAHPGSVVALDSYIQNLVKALSSSFGLPDGSIKLAAITPGSTMDESRATTTGLVLNELISFLRSTAIRTGAPVMISIGMTGDVSEGFVFRVNFNGSPFPAMLDLGTTDVLSLQLGYSLVTKQLGGTIFISEDRQGFTVSIPPE